MLYIDEAEVILKCVEGGEVIHCRGLASPQGLIDLIDQKEDQEEEGEEGEEEEQEEEDQEGRERRGVQKDSWRDQGPR